MGSSACFAERENEGEEVTKSRRTKEQKNQRVE